ncbi:universal stress protein [Ramlibacter sp. MMS24-I3-19]|uniref:universal stress protein n=1 Tax=Ramlibacter sp. MMS24-I3-19 TaxID=3416606 RepID=UPI003D041392
MKILLAADGSECTKKAAAYLMTHQAMLEGGELVILHVQPALPPRVEGFVGHQTVADYHRDEAAKVLEPIKTFVGRHELNVRTRWVVGRPAHEIVNVAREEGAHMIVMGTHGYGMIGRALMGSVAQGVIAQSDVPVLLVQ